jgi:dUTP pyrophosphatase
MFRLFTCACSTPESVDNSAFEYVLLSSNARVPTRATPGAAGYDLYSPIPYTIPPMCTVKICLEIIIKPPSGTYVRTASRSGLATKHEVFCPAGVVDPDYVGPIHMCLTNASANEYKIVRHERIGCIVFEKYGTPLPRRVNRIEETKRGGGGFGSTGKL